jgi:hypothetical protein
MEHMLHTGGGLFDRSLFKMTLLGGKKYDL